MSLTSTPGLNLSTSINNFVHFRSADGRSGRGNILRYVKREGELSRGNYPGQYVRGNMSGGNIWILKILVLFVSIIVLYVMNMQVSNPFNNPLKSNPFMYIHKTLLKMMTKRITVHNKIHVRMLYS